MERSCAGKMAVMRKDARRLPEAEEGPPARHAMHGPGGLRWPDDRDGRVVWADHAAANVRRWRCSHF